MAGLVHATAYSAAVSRPSISQASSPAPHPGEAGAGRWSWQGRGHVHTSKPAQLAQHMPRARLAAGCAHRASLRRRRAWPHLCAAPRY